MIVSHFKCPACDKSFRGGPDMRLGPGQVQWGNCGGVINTGLKNWSEYTESEKPLLVMKELLDPYSASNPLEWIYMNFMMTLLMSMPGDG